jgi:hypothetical protein
MKLDVHGPFSGAGKLASREPFVLLYWSTLQFVVSSTSTQAKYDSYYCVGSLNFEILQRCLWLVCPHPELKSCTLWDIRKTITASLLYVFDMTTSVLHILLDISYRIILVYQELTMPSTHRMSSHVASHMFSTVMTHSLPSRFILPMHRQILPCCSRRALS